MSQNLFLTNHHEKYVRAVDAEKERALNSLPKLDVNNI